MRNRIYDKVAESGPMTDVELYRTVTKDGAAISEPQFAKILLDLEILGLVRVAWITKDEKRIEVVVTEPEEEDEVEQEARRAEERDYEASFPGLEK